MFKDCNEVLGEIILHLQNAKKNLSDLQAGSGWMAAPPKEVYPLSRPFRPCH